MFMEEKGMEEKEKIPRRVFTPEQKFEIVRDIERHATVKEGLQKYQIADSLYRKWISKKTLSTKRPLYAIWPKNLMWGCDWTKLLVNHLRWYLLVLIDFFSRYVVAYAIVPSVNASHVKHIYAIGLKEQGIRKNHNTLPELRVDRGSANTSLVTKEFFEIMGAALSFAG